MNSNHKVADTSASQRLYSRAKQIIPGGTQLLSKRPELHAPEQWPAYYKSASGCEIVDLDGNTFLDMASMGIGACLLGYADPDVTAAVMQRVAQGAMCTLNPPDEVELAEELLKLHSWATHVRFLRSGGEAMAAAVRLARAATQRNLIAFCGYHGWHDWYLAANRSKAGEQDSLKDHLLPGLLPAGVPTQLAGTAVPFSYNHLEQLRQIVRASGNELATVVMEPIRSSEPLPDFVAGVRSLCDECGAVLIVDEITAGWRLTLGGAHQLYGYNPDIAVYAKTLGNGHPMAAIVGRDAVMRAAESSFISSTYWTEAVGPAAALATLRKFQQHDIPGHVQRIGMQLRTGLAQLAQANGVPLETSGPAALTAVTFKHPLAAALQTLFTVRMLGHGILATSGFYPCWSHTTQHVERYLEAADKVLHEVARAIERDDVGERIGGPVKHSGFARLT